MHLAQFSTTFFRLARVGIIDHNHIRVETFEKIFRRLIFFHGGIAFFKSCRFIGGHVNKFTY
jgi:hypothetical protein